MLRRFNYVRFVVRVVVGVALIIAATLTLIVGAFFFVPSLSRPSDQSLLKRHLGLDDTSDFTKVSVGFRSQREWTAWIYLEAEPTRIQRLLQEQAFRPATGQQRDILRWVKFPAAPPPPAYVETQVFSKELPGETFSAYAVVSRSGDQFWFVAKAY